MTIHVPKPTLIDRVVSHLNPEAGLRRMAARTRMELALGGSYASTSSMSNVRGFRPAARSALADQAGELGTLRAQCRDLGRNHPLAVGAINTNCDRVVGTGLALVAQPDAAVLGWSDDEAQAWKAQVQREFSLWADSKQADLTGHQTFYELQELVLRSALESGDCFSVLPDAMRTTAQQPYRLRVQVLEADRVGNPNGKPDSDDVAGGVRLGSGGEAQAYHVYRRHPGSLAITGDRWAGEWVEAIGDRTGRRRILHHMKRRRPEEPRGVPYLAPVIEYLRQLGTYTDAELKAAVVSSMFTVFVTTEDGNSAPIFDGADPNGAAGAGAGSARDDDIQMGHAAVVDLNPREKVEFANPTRPNTAFEPFTLAFCRLVGVALGLPYELLVKQFNSSYTASRAALLDAWIYLRGRRAWLALSFCQPVYETWLAEAVAIGRISAPGFFTDPLLRWAYTRAAWQGDSQGSINPKDEVAAFRDAIDGALMTHERAEWELTGTDWHVTLPQKAAERKALQKAGVVVVPRAGAGAAPAQQQANEQPKTQTEGAQQ